MQYLGEFLSPTNSISADSDTLVKYFYFRPDQYDNPDADLENIFIIKQMSQFPKRLDKLAENELYVVDTIEVSKRVSDEEVGVKKVSYIVTATYDLLSNLNKGSSGGGGGSNDEEDEGPKLEVAVDTEGNKVTRDTPPWKLRGTWNVQPVAVQIPFLKSVADFGETVYDITNTAGDRIEAVTQKYRFEFTYTKNYQFTQFEWDNITKPLVNNDMITFIPGSRTYSAGELLILPPSLQKNYWEYTAKVNDKGDQDPNGTQEKKFVEEYYTYTIRMTSDSDGWNKELLNIGTRAKFKEGKPAQQIYQLTVQAANGTIGDAYPKYTSIEEVMNERMKSEKNKSIVSAVAVTEPLPLDDDGKIFQAAITDPVNNPYKVLSFKQYLTTAFTDFPWEI